MIEIRATARDEWRAVAAVVSTALMHAPHNDEDWQKSAPAWEDSESLSAWDGDRCVGHVGAYRFDTLVPGGAWLKTSGVTRVGVLATHRRLGLARQLMNRLLTDAYERGQVLASLRASEARIYPRFGFGLAGAAVDATVVPRDALPIVGAAGGTMRLLRHDEILDVLPALYKRVATRVGVITRPEWMWKRYFEKALELGGDAEFVAVHTSAEVVDDGFTHYSVKWKVDRGAPPQGEGEVFDLWGADESVELALWEYLCNVDLVREWYAEERPTDDAVQLAVADWRAYQARSRWDEQWLRLLDVDAALAARTFNDVNDVVTIAVTDALLAVNCGVWEITVNGAKRSSIDVAAADLAVDVRELAAAYLGGTRWSSLAAVGRVDVRNHAAITAADALFTSTRAPFCGSGF